MITFWLYNLATFLAPLIPERIGYWLAERAGDLAFMFGRKARRRYLNNLQHVLGNSATPREKRVITRRAFQNLIKNYYDLFRMHHMTEAQLRRQLASLEGLEHVQKALARGKGAILGSIHYGNFNLILVVTGLYQKDHKPVMVPVERLRPEPLFDLVRRQRAAQGVQIVAIDDSPRPLIRHLTSGNIVGLALDVDVTRTGPLVDFFDAPAQLPEGAATLALRHDAPLILGLTRRLDDNRCVAELGPPLQILRTGDRKRDTKLVMAQIARQMEEWIRKCPEQWIMFEEVWADNITANGGRIAS